MPRDETRIAELATELERLLGQHWRGRVARALNTHPQPIRRMFRPPTGRTDEPPEMLYALAEFMASVPKEEWPDRWLKDH